MKKLKKKTVIILAILVAALAGAGGIIGYFNYQSEHFVTTENAALSATLVTITPELSGRIAEWNIMEGDDITAGQVLGRQDTGALMSSSALSTAAIASSADALMMRSEIKSPINGKVIQSAAVKGQMAAPGSSLAIVADLSSISITANIAETDINKIQPGQKVLIDIDAFPGRHFHGFVQRIGLATGSMFSLIPANNASGNFSKVTQLIPVSIKISDANDAALLPGMNATVSIAIK
jgi:multidrug resistance efflux pump